MRRIYKFFLLGIALPFFFSYQACGQHANEEVKFPKKKIQVANITITVEVAETDVQLARGLMFRKKLPANTGMLFVYATERPLSFWMKNTFIPLSIGFFDREKILVDIQEMRPVASEMQQDVPSYKSRKPAQYALEMPAAWFSDNKVKLGAKFSYVNK